MCSWRSFLLLFILFTTIILTGHTRQISKKVKRDFDLTESDELELEDYIVNAVSSPVTCNKDHRVDKREKCRRVLSSTDKKEKSLQDTFIFGCKPGYKKDFKGFCRRIFLRK